jgi:hypothetical protein
LELGGLRSIVIVHVQNKADDRRMSLSWSIFWPQGEDKAPVTSWRSAI